MAEPTDAMPTLSQLLVRWWSGASATNSTLAAVLLTLLSLGYVFAEHVIPRGLVFLAAQDAQRREEHRRDLDLMIQAFERDQDRDQKARQQLVDVILRQPVARPAE